MKTVIQDLKTNLAKTLFTMICLMGICDCTFSQPILPPIRKYLGFQGQGLLRVDTARENNITTITQKIAGGFISYGALMDYYEFPVKIKASLFPKGTMTGANQSIEDLQSKIRPYEALNMFLNVGQKFQVDLFEPGTDSLLIRYVIVRETVYPDLWLMQNQNGMMHLFTVKNSQLHNELNVDPDVPISFSQREPINQNNPEVEYTLIDKVTKEKQTYAGRGIFDLPGLKAGNEYELRYFFKLQPSSVASLHVVVKDNSRPSNAYWGIVAMAVLTLIVVILLFFSWRRNRLSKKQKQKLEDAAISLQTSLNPHFTFNALSTIQGLINTGKIDDANEYLQEFGSLLRKTLTKSQQVYNTLDQEMEMMRLYLRIESLRFQFTWNIAIAPEMNMADLEIPTLLLQPVIENSVKHGVGGMGEAGKIEILCEPAEKPGSFVITVKDNGSWKENNSGEGFGLNLTRKRIATINKLRKESSVQLLSDRSNGTEIRFIFHNWIQ